MVKNLPAMPETWVQSLGWEHPLEKGMATHSSILQPTSVFLSGESLWIELPGGLQSMGSQRVEHNRATNTHTHTHTHTHTQILRTSHKAVKLISAGAWISTQAISLQ